MSEGVQISLQVWSCNEYVVWDLYDIHFLCDFLRFLDEDFIGDETFGDLSDLLAGFVCKCADNVILSELLNFIFKEIVSDFKLWIPVVVFYHAEVEFLKFLPFVLLNNLKHTTCMS